MSQNSRRVHLDYLDAMRGLTALFVVMHHIWQIVTTRPDLGLLPSWFRIMTIFKFGSYAVAVFIVLSGYCLMLPVVRSAQLNLSGGLRSFVFRRARRILPPYYAALALSIGLIIVNPILRNPTNTLWDIALPALSAGSITSHLLLVHNWSEQWRWSVNPPLWSIALEWQIYFFFALFLLPIWRRFGAFIGVGVAFTLGCLPIWFGLDFVNTWFLSLFALGMLAATINFSAKFASKNWVEHTPWGMISALLWVVVGVLLLLGKRLEIAAIVGDICVGFATMFLLIGCTRRLQQGHVLFTGPAKKISSALSAIGHFSYSLYLIHYPLVALFYLWLLPLQLTPVVLFALLTGIGMPVIIMISYVFFYIFERPFIVAPNKQVASQQGLPQPA